MYQIIMAVLVFWFQFLAVSGIGVEKGVIFLSA